jgi:ketol-acid reductoisomerase
MRPFRRYINADVAPNMKKGAALAFAHGFNIITTRWCRVTMWT